MGIIIGLGTRIESRLLTNGRFIGHKEGVFGRKHLFELIQRPRSETSSFNDFTVKSLPLDFSRKRLPPCTVSRR